jgi:hypothetical protein
MPQAAPESSVNLCRSARSNKYDGFRISPMSDSKPKMSKVKPRKVPNAPSSVKITEITDETTALEEVAPPSTPISLIQMICTNMCGIPADELTEDALVASSAEPSPNSISFIWALFVNWNILCWNVRGLNSSDKQLALSNAITSSGCAVICLQETNKTYFDLSFIKSCSSSPF